MTEHKEFRPGDCRVRILLPAEELAARVQQLAAEIDAYYAGCGADEILLVGVLKGASIFHSDLMRALKTPVRIDFMQVSSYIGQQSSGELAIHKDILVDIAGRHVLLVEDIIDTGFTLSMLMPRLQQRQPADLKLCTVLDKREARRYDVQADFVGFVVPDKFLVGYGLDYNEYFRSLPYLGELILPDRAE